MKTTAPETAPDPPGKLGAGRVIAAVLASLLALIGLGIGFGGGAVLIANGTSRDADGFFTSKSGAFLSPTAAIVTENLDVATAGPDDVLETTGFATVRIRARSESGRPMFVGIARTVDVERFLSGVARDEITEIGDDPFKVDYRRRDGRERARPPAEQRFWAATVTGTSEQTLQWKVRGGDWSAVAMNADASPGVAIRADAGVKVRHLVAIGVGLLIGGLVFIGLGVLGVILAVRRGGRTSPPEAPITAGNAPRLAAAGARESSYPVQLEGHLDESRSRWLWLVKWFLAIPHYVCLAVLWVAFVVMTAIAFVAILLTGRYPRGIFDFNVGVVRWTWRVGFYTYSANGTDRYPPFSLGPEPDYPATLDIPYPERLSRGLVLVKWWLLAIPHYVIVGIFAGGLTWDCGLISVLVLISAIYLLFTGQTLRDLWDLIVGLNRWCFRVLAYSALMRDEYPPFRLTP